MRSYVLKRILLMIPTLVGITMAVWILVTVAPGEAGQAIQGEAQTQKGAGGGDMGRRIFRSQFNLDKPLFWNDYLDLTAEDVYATVLAAQDRDLSLAQRHEAIGRLQDWGYFAIPPLVEALDLAIRPEYRIAVLQQLGRNAKRIEPATLGRRLTPEERELNRVILLENQDIDRRLSIEAEAGPQEIEERTRQWKEWYEERRDRWDWSAGERLRISLFDTRFATYWRNLLALDLGISHVHRKPVWALIGERIRVSLILMVTSLILAYLISIPIGIWSAVRHRTRREQTMSTFLFMLYSLPSFFTAMLILSYLGIGQPWQVIPVQGFESENTFELTTWEHFLDVLYHTVAPLFCLTYTSLAALSRYAKTGLLHVIRSDFIRTARAKGLHERAVVLKHAVRNGIIPIITLLGTTLPVIVGGSVIIESVFNIPGIGLLMYESILLRDYNVIIGVTSIVAVLTMLGILLADIAYAVVDPRISY